MKKFLSLVLALVMTMSLVTISAGATEYKDLSDKDEIQYEEAVAVLNRIGIITGYEDGTFRPETELTRGAAAKIIVSLMIGPEAASALPNNASPYPDVPAGHTFAGVIGYCKTAGYISGYGDGTFKPANSLTGYAFAKMLLGALGYKSDLEGFTGTGWTMNVARLGNVAGLFNRLSFQGADAVNREEACQLALNTLKATMVEYTGGFNITAGDAHVVGAQTRTYVTSNQAYAQNILNRKADSEGNAKDDHYTVEFGEEHFKDLRLNDEHRTARDSFGRPSNEWSYKKVTIGTFPIAADFVFDKQMAHVDKTDAVKNRATGLSGYDLTDGAKSSPQYTAFWVNGVKYELNNGQWDTQFPQTYNTAEIKNGEDAKIANISDLTDNGTTVEVYVSEDDADFITDVVVVQTQLMEVRRVGSDYVSLLREGDDDPDDINNNAYNMKPISVPVDDVKTEDGAYSVLSELKEGDVVAVIPVAQDSDPTATTKYDVAAAYVPETVKGALTAVETYGTLTSTDKDPVSVTVGGTAYPIALWSRDLRDIDGEAVKMTRKDVTLYLDKNGNALKAEDVGSTDGWMVIGRYYEDVVDRHLVTMVEGWDTSGEKLELNLGNFRSNWANGAYKKGLAPGDLVRYESTTKGNAEWVISTDQGKNHVVPVDIDAVDAYSNDRIEKSDVRIPLLTNHGTAVYDNHENVYVDSTGIKFVFVTYESDGSGEVESVEVKKGVQEVTVDELKDFYDRSTKGDAAGTATGSSYYTHAQAGYTTEKKDNWNPDAVKVVVVKSESNDAAATNLMYIRDQVGGAEKLSDGTMLYHYTVVMLGPDGYFNDEVRIASDDNVRTDTFVSYSEKEIEGYSGSEKCYDLRDHSNFTGRVASTFQADVFQLVNADKGFIRLENEARVKGSTGTLATPEVMKNNRGASLTEEGGDTGVIRIYNAKFADLRSQADKRATREIASYKDLKWLIADADATVKLDKNEDGYLSSDAPAEKTLRLQLIVNDKVGNSNFREAALVVVTSVETATVAAPKSADASLRLTIDGKSVPVAAGETVEFKYDKPAQDKTVELVATIAKTATGVCTTESNTGFAAGTWTAGETTKTNTQNISLKANSSTNGVSLVITVTAEDGTTSKVYTVKLVEVDKTKWNNTFVTGSYTEAANYTAGDWTNKTTSDISVNASGALTNPAILNTGDVDEIKEQVEDSLTWLGYSNLSYQGATSGGTVLNWTADETTDTGNTISKNLNFDVSSSKVLVNVKATPSAEAKETIANHDAKISASSASAAALVANASAGTDGKAYFKVIDTEDNESWAVYAAAAADAADSASTVVKAGYTYVAKAGSKITKATVGANGDGVFTVTQLADGVAVDESKVYDADTEVTLTVTPAAAIPDFAGSYTALKVKFAGVTAVTPFSAKPATSVATNAASGSDWEFTFVGNVALTDVITYETKVVGDNVLALPNITYTVTTP